MLVGNSDCLYQSQLLGKAVRPHQAHHDHPSHAPQVDYDAGYPLQLQHCQITLTLLMLKWCDYCLCWTVGQAVVGKQQQSEGDCHSADKAS